MPNGPHIAQVAALVGDPARANILCALLDGRALTATELAHFAGVTPQTASGHLAKLLDAGLLTGTRQGRHRYFRLASPLVGQMLETLMAVAQTGPARYTPHWKGGDALRDARTCYDHLAGRWAVMLADALIRDGHVVLTADGGEISASGVSLFRGIGIDLTPRPKSRRAFCKPCLDWSERRPHLAGTVGAMLAARAFELGWIKRVQASRAVSVTLIGQHGFSETFGVTQKIFPPSY